MLAMAAASLQHDHRKSFYSDSPSSSSLEQLMFEEESCSSSGSRSSAELSRSSLSAQDLRKGFNDNVTRSRSFEGERRRKKHPRSRPKPNRSGDEEEHNVGRCVAGCAADCTALCCCPLTLFHIIGVLCVRIPAAIASRISRALRKARSKKTNSKLRSSDSIASTANSEICTTPTLTPSVSGTQQQHQQQQQQFSFVFGTPPSPIPLPAPSHHGFGYDLWKEFESGHSSP